MSGTVETIAPYRYVGALIIGMTPRLPRLPQLIRYSGNVSSLINE